MSTYSRNLPDGGGQPAPPPPPPDGALLWEMRAAQRADRDAMEILEAMDADPATYGDLIMAAWDRAVLAAQEAARLSSAYAIAQKWQKAGRVWAG